MAKLKTKKVTAPAPEVVETITSQLSVDELRMKNLCWQMKLKIKSILPKSYHDFAVKFLFDEEPATKRIAQLNERIKDNKNPRLFKEIDQQEVEEIKTEIKDVERNWAENKKLCVTIEFLAQVEQLKYAGGDTILTIRIPDNVIEPINKVKMTFGLYKVELKPQI